MKSNKLLLGMFAGLLALTGGAAHAQFYEIGPDNIGGKVSSIVIDNQDANHSTIYAGAISGGLFVRTSDVNVLQNLYADVDGTVVPVEELASDTTRWHMVRLYNANGEELTLPISAMAQLPNGELILGTGDNTYAVGSIYNSMMSSRGRGIYRYNPANHTLSLFASDNSLYPAVRAIDYAYSNDTLFLFVATSTGLYRWTIASESNWTSIPKCIQTGSVDNLVVSRALKMAYFTIGNQLYKIGNIKASDTQVHAVNISGSNSAFGGTNKSIKLAMAPSDNTHLYAMVIDKNGIVENVYLTTNGQGWTTLTTNSVKPILYSVQSNSAGGYDTVAYNPGNTCATITVDPTNPKRIILGGTNIWIGEGGENYIEGSYFLWTKSSYSEWELNGGDYMGSVFTNSAYVHSGIQQIVPCYNVTPNISGTDTFHFSYYIATDGGIHNTLNDFSTYSNINRGLNAVQITGLDVCADGSIISGAAFNGCPFIESRMAHSGGDTILTWYDYGQLGNLNHSANVLWTGTGNQVAASGIYQIIPQSRRNIYVSSNGHMGRAYADYLNYTNTQTWTTDNNFLTSSYSSYIGNISYWESTNDTYFKDSIKVNLDLRGYYFKNNGDTIWINQDANRKINAGEKAMFLAKNNSEYPFMHTFTSSEVGSGAHQKTVSDTFLVKNPVVSRMLAVIKTSDNRFEVVYSWTASDFSRVWDAAIATSGTAEEKEKMMKWSSLVSFPHTEIMGDSIYPRCVAMSNDGRDAFISTYNDRNHHSQLLHIKGLDNVNYNQKSSLINAELYWDSQVKKVQTYTVNNGANNRFNRPISSIYADPRPGQDRIVVTFEDYSDNYDNVILIENASNPTGYTITPIGITGHNGIPAYSAIIEKTTGNIYVGTSEGVFIYNGSTWHQYEHLKGIPVTAIAQQTKELPVRRHIGHTGINENKYLFAKTKWPRAIYFGTYGRGIFLDMEHVTDTENEIYDTNGFNPLVVPTVNSIGMNSVSVYPNPVMGEANLDITAAVAGTAVLRVYDLNGRLVINRTLGHIDEGEQTVTLNTTGMTKGMYLVNVIIGGHTAATKMLVR